MWRKTSFGQMKTLLERDGEIVSELLQFFKNGRNHHHNIWEIVYVTQGEGIIVHGEHSIPVKKGDTVKIEPNADHWMETDEFLEVLLVYTHQP